MASPQAPKAEAPAPKIVTEAPAADPRAAHDAEEQLQADIVAAVAKAHVDELPKLGGELVEPGLGR